MYYLIVGFALKVLTKGLWCIYNCVSLAVVVVVVEVMYWCILLVHNFLVRSACLLIHLFAYSILVFFTSSDLKPWNVIFYSILFNLFEVWIPYYSRRYLQSSMEIIVCTIASKDPNHVYGFYGFLDSRGAVLTFYMNGILMAKCSVILQIWWRINNIQEDITITKDTNYMY